jgi:hypothetical protein
MRRAWMAALAMAALAGSEAAGQTPARARPRLVVAIAVDQLRADYMDRFRPFFGRGGFNLFLERGASFAEARYEHATTSTCPGHAVFLTGSYGNVNGIIANDWYDVSSGREVYCAADTTVTLIGSSSEGRSPRNLHGGTVGDVLKYSTGGASRVVAVAAKDRSAIMMGGHLADGAYWMEDSLFVTSTYYRRELPGWASEFNGSRAVTSAFGKQWDRLLPAAAYEIVGPDDVAAETDEAGMGRTFPHPIGGGAAMGESFFGAFHQSPFSNDAVADFAMRAVSAEALGRDSVTDLLAISFSANDRVGHAYGPDSHEVMDITLRLDRTLARLFGFLDRRVGLANVLIVLTADHGVGPMPEVLQRLRPGIRARRLDPDSITAAATRALDGRYGAAGPGGWIAHHDFPHIYLNVRALAAGKIALEEAERVARDAIAAVPGVHEALTATELGRQRREGVRTGSVYSFDPLRSGHLYYQLEPYLVADGGVTGADHGTRWAYDQQVPVLWYGAAVRPGIHQTPAAVADIAPTLSAILGIMAPGGAQGRVLAEMLR